MGIYMCVYKYTNIYVGLAHKVGSAEMCVCVCV
jgi:hypothetical protein